MRHFLQNDFHNGSVCLISHLKLFAMILHEIFPAQNVLQGDYICPFLQSAFYNHMRWDISWIKKTFYNGFHKTFPEESFCNEIPLELLEPRRLKYIWFRQWIHLWIQSVNQIVALSAWYTEHCAEDRRSAVDRILPFLSSKLIFC